MQDTKHGRTWTDAFGDALQKPSSVRGNLVNIWGQLITFDFWSKLEGMCERSWEDD